jgi:hypothetical protein
MRKELMHDSLKKIFIANIHMKINHNVLPTELLLQRIKQVEAKMWSTVHSMRQADNGAATAENR